MRTPSRTNASRPILSKVFYALAALCFSLAVVPARAATNTVTSILDSGPGSLRAAITNAAAGDTINFFSLLSGLTITLGGTELLINKNLTIDASALPDGIIINGNNASRVFEISSGRTVNLKFLTITGGRDSSGGGIWNNSGNLTLENCTVSGNSTTTAGGGILNWGTLTLNNSTVAGNAANLGGGINSSASLTLNNSTLSGNVATNNGGAIISSGTLTLNNSTVAGNSAGNLGGGIVSSSTLALNNATLVGNAANTNGGGIYSYNGSLTLNNTIVAGNSAPTGPDVSKTGGTMPPPLGVNLLGNTNNSTLTAGATVLVGNPLLAGLGNYGGPTQTMPPLLGSPVINAATNGLATDQRGLTRPQGAGFDIGAAEMQFLTVTHTADGGPGSLRQAVAEAGNNCGIWFASGLSGQTITLTNGQILITNKLSIDASALPDGITLNGNHASRIFEVAGGTTVVLDSLTLTGGNADNGGGIYTVGGTVTLNNSTVAGNTASNRGGGIYKGSGSGLLVLNNSTVMGNVANNGGGVATYNSPGSTIILNNATVSGNSATDSGGGLYNHRGRLTLNNATVSGNSATNSGGGIYYLYDDTVGSILAANNSIVAGNSAPSDANIFGSPYSQSGSLIGGNPLLAPLGYYGGRTQTMPPLPGSPAIDTAASGLATDQRGLTRPKDGDRSGIAQYDIGAVEVGPTYVVNTAADQNDGVAANGISLRDAIADTPVIPDSQENRIFFDPAVFNGETNDTITLSHDSIVIEKNVNINASTLINGVTVNGNNVSRVFWIDAGWTVAMDSLTITGGYSDTGGGILNSGSLTLNRATVSGNSSTSIAGGIFNNGTLTLNNSTLYDNAAPASDGGGIYNNSSLNLNNSTLYGNFANVGGGIANGGILILNHTTLSGNSSTSFGGGINNGGSLQLNNSIIAGNSSASGPDIDNTSEGGTVLPPTGVNLLSDLGNSGLTAGGSILVGDPLLAPLGNYGGPTQTMPPLPDSPAIDAATNGPATDQRGVARPQGANFDIGAVEFLPAVVTTAVDEDNVDPGTGLSLREAIANPFVGSITFDPAVFNGEPADTILLTNGQLTIQRPLIIDGSALTDGIQVSGNHASRIFEFAALTTNTLAGLTLTAGATSSDNGGAIKNSGALILENCTVADNHATGWSGGAIMNDQGTLTLTRCTLSGNGSTYHGGAIFNGQGDVTLTQCTLAGNTAGGNGGAIAGYLGSLSLTHCTLSGNASTDGPGPDDGHGGAIDNYGGSLALTNTLIAANTATTEGPDIGRSGSIITGGANFIGDLAGSGLSPSSDLLTGDAMLAPIGLYGGATETMPPLLGSPVIDAATTGLPTDQRGVARPQGGNYDIGAVEFLGAVVTTAADEDNIDPGTGLSLREAIDNPLIGSITFDSAVFNGEPADIILLTNGQLTISRPLIIDASAITGGVTVNGNQGSRVFGISPGQTVVLDFLTITNGVDFIGGGIENSGTLTLNHVDVIHNLGGGYAGGIFNSGTLTLNQCNITDNSGGTGGGGIRSYGSLVLKDSVVSGNSADSGGGIRVESGSVTVTNSTVSSNSAGNDGGGIYLQFGTVTLNHTTLFGNVAGGSGTAPVASGSPRAPAVAFGGGIFQNGGILTLTNTTVAGNVADGGGGICQAAGATELTCSTVTGNTAQLEYGGGVAIDTEGSAPVSVLNTIVAGNISSDVDLVGGTSVNNFNSLGHNLIGNGNAVAAFSQPGDLTNRVPNLSPLANYGGPTLTRPPLPGSPAIDAGIDTGSLPATDQRGLARVVNGIVDIGAVEVQLIIATDPPVLTGLTVLGDGTFQFAFTNLSGAGFSVFASTNVAAPLNTWSNLGPAVETPPGSGQFQFADPDATNYPKRFYRVTSP